MQFCAVLRPPEGELQVLRQFAALHRAQACRDALERVRRTLREFAFGVVQLLQSYGGVRGKARQQRREKFAIARALAQSALDIDAGYAEFTCRAWRSAPAQDRPKQHVRVDRLGQVFVHALGQATLALFGHGVGGHGNDRQILEARLLAQRQRGLMPVHDRHLQVHEDHGPRQGIRRGVQHFERLLPVFRQ